jgi:hypothetical protein
MNFHFKSGSLICILTLSISVAWSQSPFPDSKKVLIAEILKKYELDTLSILTSRIKETPHELEQTLSQNGKFHPVQHALNQSEQKQLDRAFTLLPAVYLKIIKAHVRSISFVDSVSYRALTYTVNHANYGIYDIVINGATLGQDVSTWLTAKERTCFETTNSPFSVSFLAGKMDAIVYVLMHEATHVVDDVLGLTEPTSVYFKANNTLASAFSSRVWSNRRNPASQFRYAVLDSTRFRGGKPLPVETAPRIYAAFQQTPFVSLYSMSSSSEDIADLFAVYCLTEHLGQPYAIEIKQKEKVVFRYEPAKSAAVRERFNYAELVFGQSR